MRTFKATLHFPFFLVLSVKKKKEKKKKEEELNPGQPPSWRTPSPLVQRDGHSALTQCRPVLALTLFHQVSVRAATTVPRGTRQVARDLHTTEP